MDTFQGSYTGSRAAAGSPAIRLDVGVGAYAQILLDAGLVPVEAGQLN